MAYPTYRCAHCTLMRCYEADATCDECQSYVGMSFPRRLAVFSSDDFAPYIYFNVELVPSLKVAQERTLVISQLSPSATFSLSEYKFPFSSGK